jgi:hypothetical protein
MPADTCPVCLRLPVRDLRKLNEAIQDGSLPVAALAQQFGLLPTEVAAHAKTCVDPDQVDGFGHLADMVRRLSCLSKSIEQDILNGGAVGEDGEPRGPAITDYVAILRETRETIVALRRLQSVDDAVVGLTRNVVGPLVSSATTICVEEMRRMRETLFPLVSTQHHTRVKETVDTALERIGARLKAESMHDLREKVEAVLQSKPVGKQ